MTHSVDGKGKRFGLFLLRVLILSIAALGAFVIEGAWGAEDEFAEGLSWRWVLLLVGGGLVLIAIAVQVVWGWRVDLSEARNEADLARFRVAMKDALLPMIAKVSEMPDMTPSARLSHLPVVADAASWALATLLLRQVDRARAAVYAMEPARDALRVIGFGGRGERPGDFVKGALHADAALARVARGDTLVVRDREKDPPPGYDGRQAEWRSFASVSIVSNDGYAYGMLNADSSSSEMFNDTEVQVMSVVAEILSVAFALAYPRSSRPAKGAEGMIAS